LHDLPDKDQIWVYIFAMLFSGSSWLGRALRSASGDEEATTGRLIGGLIGALLLGFTVATVLLHYTELDVTLIWTVSIFAGAIGEQVVYQIVTSLIKNKTGIDIKDKRNEDNHD